VARIIYVEDESAWLELTRTALIGHQVDAADSFRKAVALIRENEPYDLALVDLNLGHGDDRLGAEILDLLRMDYPGTRRIVVTGHPPIGGLRANIFERYGVEEIIIKGSTTLPDLRKIVTEVLRADPSVNVTQDFKVDKSELAQRYRDWHAHLETIIRTKIREAQDDARKPGRMRNRPANTNESRLLLLREEFVRAAADFESALAEATSMPDITAASAQLGQLISKFSRMTPA
jgi:CheY-like chemotaxis protein